MKEVLFVKDPRGFGVSWGDDEGVEFNEQDILNKQEYMLERLRGMGLGAHRAVLITEPASGLSLATRAMILCEMWFDCHGAPTLDQWERANDDMWNSFSAYCAALGKDPGIRPDNPPLPRPKPAFGVVQGGKEEDDE